MTPERWQQIYAVFGKALDLEPSQYAAFLDQACAGDSELRARIEDLLAHDAAANQRNFLAPVREAVRTHVVAEDDGADLVGRQIGFYQIQKRIGQGGMGVVYQAYDQRRQVTVALKTLRQRDPAALYRFKREFRTLADLSHPNLVSLHELIAEGSQWFFTMELVEGRPFLEYTRSRSTWKRTALSQDETAIQSESARDRPSPAGAAPVLGASQLNRLRSALRHLAEGLVALHDAGKLHRDLKPANVLVTTEGRVVILDFGLAAELEPSGCHQSTEQNVLGTASYMAPEQAAGKPVSPAADWYSVGVMLYEALTGQLPFSGTVLQVLQDKQHIDPSPPSALQADLPEDLDRLCVELLRRNARERPTGREVLSRLGAGFPVNAAPLAPVKRPLLIGREPQLQALNEAFRTVADGQAVVVCVHGRSGMGKSALVQHFLDSLSDEEQAVVLTARCYEREAVPYKALDNLVDVLSHYLAGLSPPEARALLPRDVTALTRLFPVVRRVPAVAETTGRSGEVPDAELRRRGFAALRELLARLGDRARLVLAIDDLQLPPCTGSCPCFTWAKRQSCASACRLRCKTPRTAATCFRPPTSR